MRLISSLLLLLITAVVVLSTTSAYALPPFKGAFDEKYVKKSDSEDLKAAFKAQSCNVCHVKGKKKNVQNRYGHELHEVLEDMLKEAKIEKGPKDLAKDAEGKKQLLEMLGKAFDAVAKMKAKNGTTYGEILKGGQLPSQGDN